ncbi:MAG TPA: CsbD family protein [Chloroflexota bacterium]|nr:CsbD family protein [Chloroflexota bacterium]
MNQDVFAGKWKQAKGKVKQWWGDLTDDEIDRIEGRQEELIGLLQERYGWSREEAQAELERRFHTVEYD